MLTGFGRKLRQIRIDRNELLYDMAGKLSISVSDLSAFENGKKKVQEDLLRKVILAYNLNEQEAGELLQIAHDEADMDKERETSSCSTGRFHKMKEFCGNNHVIICSLPYPIRQRKGSDW